MTACLPAAIGLGCTEHLHPVFLITFKIVLDHFITLTLSVFCSLSPFSFCKFYHGVDGTSCCSCSFSFSSILYDGQHNSTVVNTSSQQEGSVGSWFSWSFFVEFASSPCVCVGLPQVLWFPPIPKHGMANWLIG